MYGIWEAQTSMQPFSMQLISMQYAEKPVSHPLIHGKKPSIFFGLMRNSLMILALGVMLMSSDCSPDPILEATTDASINFVATFGDELFMPQTTYHYNDNVDVQLDQFSFYISNLVLLKEVNVSSDETEIKEIVLLDFGQMKSLADAAEGLTVVTHSLPIGEYQGIKFGIGVSSDLNRTKPAEYSVEHPLSQHGLYESEHNSYIFSELTGIVDPDKDGIFDSSFGYRAATDDLFREEIFVSKFTLFENSTYDLKLNIDIKRLLGTEGNLIDLINNPSDSDFNISRIISDNFSAAISIE